ncbi:hypothetical protein BCR44DRAFT_44680, partial [Catenaria anguillulae PL171]
SWPLISPERACTVILVSDGALKGGDVLRNLLAMQHVELHGAGGASFLNRIHNNIPSVTRLVLDYDTPIDMILARQVPSAYSHPSLTSLTITFTLAESLLSHVQPPATSSSPSLAFPYLLNLTLINTRPESEFVPMPDILDPASLIQWLPRLPYEHIPALTSLSVPATHRECPNPTRAHVHDLVHLLTTCAHLTHFYRSRVIAQRA